MQNELLKRVFTGLGVLCLGLMTACSTAEQLCVKAEECSDKPRSADYAKVCAARKQNQLDMLRANDDQKCRDFADAVEAIWACQSRLECVDFDESDNNDRCEQELKAIEDIPVGVLSDCVWPYSRTLAIF